MCLIMEQQHKLSKIFYYIRRMTKQDFFSQ
uniref:Uncharacterized protein n=1 Tax=Rhizophora mucronata TaxID=61149 RepID=A0A2P2QYM9_RHIMU